jgi:hypothetical protein
MVDQSEQKEAVFVECVAIGNLVWLVGETRATGQTACSLGIPPRHSTNATRCEGRTVYVQYGRNCTCTNPETIGQTGTRRLGSVDGTNATRSEGRTVYVEPSRIPTRTNPETIDLARNQPSRPPRDQFYVGN